MVFFSTVSLFFYIFICSTQVIFSLYLNSSYSSQDVTLYGGNHYVDGFIKLQNLTIHPCTSITFQHFTSQISVSNGIVKILGNASCPVLVSLKQFPDEIFDIELNSFKGINL